MSHHQKSVLGQDAVFLKLTIWNVPGTGSSLELIPGHQRGFWEENNSFLKLSPHTLFFSIKPMSYFLSKSFGSHAVTEYKENAFINSPLTLS